MMIHLRKASFVIKFQSFDFEQNVSSTVPLTLNSDWSI